ncbi:MAG: NAD(P)-dependent oxidoreductase [candidate division WOR-3 bacterium]
MKLLITGALKIDEEQRSKLKKLGFDLVFHQNENEILPDSLFNIEGVICNSLFLYNDIENFKNLKFIQLTSAGFDRVPLEYIKKKRIKIFNAKGVYSIPIAEMVILKILEIYKKSRKFEKAQTKHKWEKIRDLEELSDKNIGILGFGDIGKEIAKRLKPFGVRIFVCDIKKSINNLIEKFYCFDELNNFLKNIDVLILSLPLNETTKGLIDYERMNLLKDGCVLINISRGEIVVEKDLTKLLKKNKFKGIYLDVFEQEPLNKNSPLWDFENVLITPHNSFVSEKTNERLFNLIYQNLKTLKRKR